MAKGVSNMLSGLGILGSFLNIGSSIYGASLQRRITAANTNVIQAQGAYQGAVAEYNAAVARSQALALETVADIDIARQRKIATRLRGTQVAGYAKAGVKLEGSPLEVMIDSAAEAEKDIAITRYNAKIGILQAGSQVEQYNISKKIALSNAATSSNLLRASAKFNQSQVITKGTTTLLTDIVSSFAR